MRVAWQQADLVSDLCEAMQIQGRPLQGQGIWAHRHSKQSPIIQPRKPNVAGARTAVCVRAAAVAAAPVKATTAVIRPAHAADVLAAVDAHCKQGDVRTPHLVLMFTATWCGPCTLVYKELQKLAALRPKNSFQVLSVDVDQDANKELASQLGIQSLPTLVFVGKDRNKKSISTVGHVSSRLIADVLDSKMNIAGADLEKRLRLS